MARQSERFALYPRVVWLRVDGSDSFLSQGEGAPQDVPGFALIHVLTKPRVECPVMGWFWHVLFDSPRLCRCEMSRLLREVKV